MEARPARYSSAGFWRRAAAYLIDSLVVSFVWFVVFFSGAAAIADPNSEDANDALYDALAVALFLAGPAIWFLYQWACNSMGVSIGTKKMSLAVRRLPDGSRPGVKRGLLRTLGQALAALPVGLGFWWALWDARRQGWHDKMAGTFVVRVQQEPSAAELRVPKWLPPWMRAKYAKYLDPLALKKALEGPLPMDAATTPVDVPLGAGPGEPRYALAFVASFLPLVLFRLVFGFAPDLPTLLLFTGEVLLVIGGGIELSGLNRRIQISGEGIRLVKIYGTRTMLWGQVQRVEAKPDLMSMRAVARDRRISWSCRLVPPEKRRDIIVAIRARLPAGVPIQEWPKEGQFVLRSVRFGLGSGAMALFFVASFMGVSAYGHVLGLRCAVSTHYLRERFALPEERGCVILRVTGAAEKAGLRQGDMMIAMDDIPITSDPQFHTLLESSSKSRFTFTVLRPGSEVPLDFAVKLGPGSGPAAEDPNDPFFYYLRARNADRDHTEEGIDDYTRAIELAPDFDLAYLYRGGLYWDLDDSDAARRDFMRALELDPGLGAAHRALGYLPLFDRDYTSAKASIEKAIALDECQGGFTDYNIDCAQDLYLLAATCGYPDFPKGIEAAQESIEFYPHFAEPYFQLAYFYEALGDQENAEEYAERYLSFPESDRDCGKSEQMRDLLASS